MADKAGKALDEAKGAATHGVMYVEPCLGGAHLPHGSTGARIACLERALRQARAETQALRASLQKLLAKTHP